MIKIRLICAMGMSTSMVVQKMREAADQLGLKADIAAQSETAFEEQGETVDLLLLGPQIGHLLAPLQERYRDAGFPIAVIDMMDYGMLNGEKILKDGLALIEEAK